jgi:hypothetical protein
VKLLLSQSNIYSIVELQPLARTEQEALFLYVVTAVCCESTALALNVHITITLYCLLKHTALPQENCDGKTYREQNKIVLIIYRELTSARNRYTSVGKLLNNYLCSEF